MKRSLMWVGVLAIASPMLMGADGCIFVAHHEYINTNSYPGRFEVDVGRDAPFPVCADDPHGLNTAWGLEHRLRLWIGQGAIPEYAWGFLPDGLAFADLSVRGQQGWLLDNWLFVPTRIELRPSAFGNLVFRAMWYVQQGTVQYGACADGSFGRCNFLNIQSQINPQGNPVAGAYFVSSGWFIPATGEDCVTVWRNVPLVCNVPNYFDEWYYCHLPNNAEPDFPPPDHCDNGACDDGVDVEYLP